MWISIWVMGYRYGIWDIDMGDDRIDTVILDIDVEYLVTLTSKETSFRPWLVVVSLEW